MWFEALKKFGHLKEGDKFELKEDSQHKILVDKGLIKESEAPKVETPEAVAGTYSTDSIKEKVKKTKEEKA